MKLPEAIALMLEGKVMVDDSGFFYRMTDCYFDDEPEPNLRRVEYRTEAGRPWLDMKGAPWPINGWREATAEELKEIGL